jgi:hypothetical protein
MKFLCLCYYDVEKFAALSPEQMAEIGPNCKPFDAKLAATGKVIASGSLSEPEDWKTIRPKNRTPSVSAGALVNTPEQVGAFFIVDAENVDAAIAVASNHAAANYDEHIGFAVEVRPCASFE